MRLASLALIAALPLAGCGLFSEDERLPGDRIPVRVAAVEAVMDPARAAEIAALGPPFANPDWTQLNAVSTRAPGHLAAPAALREAWRTDVGRGSGGASRITAEPIVAGGRVFALDAASGVSAVDAGGGGVLWRASVAPQGARGEAGFGGGLGYADGRVFAATGFGEVVALNAADGAEVWRQRLGAPLRAGPAVADGRVIVVTRDNAGFGLDVETGGLLWRALGAVGGAGVLGGASPAVSGELAVLPFLSGELLAVRASNGRRLWSDALTGGGRGVAGADILDISGDPVIAGAAVFAANHAGQMVAIDGRTGRRGWLRALGAATPVWSVGATLFVLTNDARLLRVAGPTGETMWSVDLPQFTRPDRSRGRITYGGPVVAGERVFVTSSAEGLLAFDAQTGAEVARVEVPGGASTGPVVAGGALYVLSDRGVLHAFR